VRQPQSYPQAAVPRHGAGPIARAPRRPRLLRLVSVAVVAAILAACGTTKPPPKAPPPVVESKPVTDPAELDPSKAKPGVPVKVALLLPLSGKFAKLGKAMQQAAEMAVFETKSQNLQIIPLDTGGTRAGAAAATEKAVAQGVKLIVGPLFAEAVAGAKPVAAQAKLNIIAFSNTPTVAGGNVFLLSFLVKQQVDRIVEYAASQGKREIGLLAPNDEGGRQIADWARAAAQKNGATITRVAYFGGNITKMQAEVKAFTGAAGITRKGVAIRRRALGYDALLIHAGGATLRTLTSLLAFYDVDPDKVQFLGTGRWDHPSTRSETSLKGGWFASPPPELRERFTARYKEAYSSTPPRIASLAYDAIALAAVLARDARSEADNPYTVEAITNPSGFLGVDGIFRFAKDGLSERGLAVLEVTPEEFRIIGPAPQSFAPRPAGEEPPATQPPAEKRPADKTSERQDNRKVSIASSR
jgi:branched-chain amino acid transport system substrate-binding protein